MFNLIDFQNWERKEHFEYYRTKIKCGYSCTVQLDVTNFLEKVKSNGLKFYPSFVYCVAKIVNSMNFVWQSMKTVDRGIMILQIQA